MSRLPSNASTKRSSYPGALLADGATILTAHAAIGVILPTREGALDGLAVAFGAVLYFAGAEANGLYRSWRGAPLVPQVRAVVRAWTVVAVLMLAVAVLSGRAFEPGLRALYTWLVASPLLLVGWRALVRFVTAELYRHGKGQETVAIVGATPLGSSLAALIAGTPSLGLRFVGYYEDTTDATPHPGVVGDLEALLRDARSGAVKLVYVSLPAGAELKMTSLLHRLADTTCSVFVVPDVYAFNMLRTRWTTMQGLPVVSISSSPFAGLGGLIKRIEDVVLGSICLTIAAVPMLLIAVGVALTSRGPVLFRQKRYGLNGERIDVLKFRTMTVAENGDDVRQATRNDPRITRFGGFLRKTSLDELPQLFQVVAGSMSLVGPRPHAVAHNELYRSLVHGYMLRHKIKPGITGWAQVNGWRGETETLDKMRGRIEYDLAYMRDWRVTLDLKILFLTLLVAWTQRNAY